MPISSFSDGYVGDFIFKILNHINLAEEIEQRIEKRERTF